VAVRKPAMLVLYMPLILLCIAGLVWDMLLALRGRRPLILPLVVLSLVLGAGALALRTRPLPGVIIGCCALTVTALLVSRRYPPQR